MTIPVWVKSIFGAALIFYKLSPCKLCENTFVVLTKALPAARFTQGILKGLNADAKPEDIPSEGPGT